MFTHNIMILKHFFQQPPSKYLSRTKQYFENIHLFL